MDSMAPLYPCRRGDNLLMKRSLGYEVPVHERRIATHRGGCDSTHRNGYRSHGKEPSVWRSHNVEPAAGTFEDTTVDKFGEELVGVSPIEPKLLPRRDGILGGEHAASWRDL